MCKHCIASSLIRIENPKDVISCTEDYNKKHNKI